MSKGIIRGIDDLGRIHIPKEYQERLNIKPGDNMEMFITSENEITIKPFMETNARFERCMQELIDIAKASNTPSSILQITANTFARQAMLLRAKEEMQNEN